MRVVTITSALVERRGAAGEPGAAPPGDERDAEPVGGRAPRTRPRRWIRGSTPHRRGRSRCRRRAGRGRARAARRAPGRRRAAGDERSRRVRRTARVVGQSASIRRCYRRPPLHSPPWRSFSWRHSWTRRGRRSSRRSTSGSASRRSRPIPPTPPTCGPRPHWCADRMRAVGLEHVQLLETAGPPVGLRRLAPRTGRADGAGLRPPRRAAGRSARRVGLATVRADRARRSAVRPGRRRRQGSGPLPPRGDPGAAGPRRPRCRST